MRKVSLLNKTDASNRLSGCQQQRVVIVRALAMKPQTMLFEELASALDPALVGKCWG